MKIANIITVTGIDKSITIINVIQSHNNIPRILSKTNVKLIIKSIPPRISSSLILNYYS